MNEPETIAYLYLLAAFGVFAVLAAAAGILAWVSNDRWMGATGRRVIQAGGAFRATEVTTDPKQQHRRWLVLGTAVLSMGWAILTFFFFAPAGALGSLIMGVFDIASRDGRGFWLALGAASIDAIPLTIALVISSLLLVQRSEQASKVGMGTAIYSAIHHGALVVVGILYAAFSNLEEGLAVFTVVAAVPGLLLAGLTATSALLARRDV
ncbi:MAG: hypothetical protein R3B82_14715 [Sandaracinaceae bacterium]